MEEKANKYKKKKILSAQLYKAESAFFLLSIYSYT